MAYQVGEFERGGRVRGTHCGVQRLDQPARAKLVKLHPTPYTLHPTPCTLHPTTYALHPTLTPYATVGSSASTSLRVPNWSNPLVVRLMVKRRS